MSASRHQWSVVAVALVALAAGVAPWIAPTAAAEPTASFEKRVVYEESGDVANVTVHADAPATVHLGASDAAFLLEVQVGKGTTKLRINTYKAGVADRYPLSEMVWAAKGGVRGRTLVTDPIDAPLEPTQYPMNVTIDGVEKDLSSLVVRERSTEAITARIAPRATDVSDLSSGADVREVSVPPWNGSVARDDWLLLHVDATGVNGLLGVDGPVDASLLGTDGPVSVTVVQTNPAMNEPRNEFAGDDLERAFTHHGSEGFYLALDTGDHGIDPGDRYRVTFEVAGDGPLADDDQTVSTGIRVVERRVELRRNGPGRTIVVEGVTTISGTTTLTPGTTVNLTARDPDVAPLFQHREVAVEADRTFSVPFDFSGLDPGREFEFRLRDQGRTVPAVVAGATTTAPETTEPTDTTTEPADTTTQPPTTTPPTTTVPATTRPPTTTTRPPPATTTASPTTATPVGITQRPLDRAGQQFTQQAVQTKAGGGPVPGFGPTAVAVAVAAGLLLAARRG